MMLAWTQRILEIDPNAVMVEEELSANPLVAPAPNEQIDKLQALTVELDTLRREQAKLQQAVFEAAQLQRRLCAPRELNWNQFEIAGEIFPVRHLSGDFFKVMELGSALGIALGDIAGKGLTAGIWQARLMGLVQQCARKHSNPAGVLAEINSELCLAGEPPITALFFARIDPVTNELTYCNAGLPAPLLLRGNRVISRLEIGGPMLGAMKDAPYQFGTIRLDAGDMLVAYSDGVTECRNSDDIEFEMDRLTAAAAAVSGGVANKGLFSLLGTVLDFAGSCSPADDMTLLVIRRRPATSTESGAAREKDSVPHRRSRRPRGRSTSRKGDIVPKN